MNNWKLKQARPILGELSRIALYCKPKRFTGNFFIKQTFESHLEPLKYSSAHGKCGKRLSNDVLESMVGNTVASQ